MTNGLDVAVGIKKGIISMSNPRYAEVWKLLGQLVGFSAHADSTMTPAKTAERPARCAATAGSAWWPGR